MEHLETLPHPRARSLAGLTLLALAGCQRVPDEAEPEPIPLAAREGSLEPMQENNLRVMNVNADCDEDADYDPEEHYDMDLRTRMTRLASIIAANDPDVVVIHDSRSYACRERFVERLRSTYPHFVEDIYYSNHEYMIHPLDWPGLDHRPSSGLMLFSKHPLEPFPGHGSMFGQETVMVHDCSASDVECSEDSGGSGGVTCNADCPTVPKVVSTPIFVEGSYFDETSGYVAARQLGHDIDTFDATAMVRIRPRDGGVFHVMLAGWKHHADWNSGVAASEEMIEEVVSEEDRTTRPIFGMGELAMDGMKDDFGDDWWEAFESPAPPDLFKCKTDGLVPGTICMYLEAGDKLFTDAWGFVQPDSDLGQTRGIAGQTSLTSPDPLTDQGGTREDFLVYSDPRQYLCMQRLRRVFFADPDPNQQDYKPSEDDDGEPFPDGRRVSKSFPLVADFLFARTDRCLAMQRGQLGNAAYGSQPVSFTASPVFTTTLDLGNPDSGNRRHNAWFVINDDATISIAADPRDAANFEVYHHSDLSTPVASWHGLETTWKANDGHGEFTGPVFDFTDPPYYVRFERSRSADLSQTFEASFHKHSCTNPENDYCIVSNNDEFKTSTWPEGKYIIPFPASGATPAYVDAQYFVGGVALPDSQIPPSAVFTIRTSDDSQFVDEEHAQVFPHCSFDVSQPDCGQPPCNKLTPGAELGPWSAITGGSEAQLDTGNDVTGNFSPDTPGEIQPVLLRVRRTCEVESECEESTMKVRFAANFFQLEPVSLECLDEEDGGDNDDEMFIQVVTDGASVNDEAFCVQFVPGDPNAYNDVGRFDEHGETHPKLKGLSEGWAGPWNLGPQTFTQSASVSLCESDYSEVTTSDNDFYGSFTRDISADPLPVGVTSMDFTETLETGPNSFYGAYAYTYRITTEDPIWPPACNP